VSQCVESRSHVSFPSACNQISRGCDQKPRRSQKFPALNISPVVPLSPFSCVSLFNCVRPFTLTRFLSLAGSHLPALDDAEQELSPFWTIFTFLFSLLSTVLFSFFFMPYPVCLDLKCWISYHLSLARCLSLPYPRFDPFSILSFLSILYVTIPSSPFSFPWSRVRWKPRATIWAIGHGEMDRIRGVLMSLLMCHARSVVGL